MRHMIGPAGRLAACLAALGLAACEAYNPPPEAEALLCANNNCVEGEPIRVRFSEAIDPASLSITVWPGEQDSYDIEGERLATVKPLLLGCAVSAGCGDGAAALVLEEGDTVAALFVEPGALGPRNRPLVLEISGDLADPEGRRKVATKQFDFQMVMAGWASFQPGLPADDPRVVEGAYTFYTNLDTPLGVALPQQYFGDLRVNRETGRFLFLFQDADPIDGAPQNTTDPAQMSIDTGEEAFIFLADGVFGRNGDDIVFESVAFEISLTVGPITFALFDCVLRGSISLDPATGESRWDGTMFVGEVMIQVGQDDPNYHPPQQENFICSKITPEQRPEEAAVVCEADPCAHIAGPQCSLLLTDEAWPVAEICGAAESQKRRTTHAPSP
ncbi:hypothetical protein KKF91_13165 [Myxococcota bacterium]|nr:hypothetical protein [Myxococcota bacterium]MBU1431486.1 hypothetical protein [Myxococcota bacterium]MBU1898251.1 hypothetical protein [Myxococcota bacterium]